MGEMLTKEAESLVSLIQNARTMLEHAETSAEVLEAQAMADTAYDMAKRAGRLAKAQQAHDDVQHAARRMQADSLRITARAQIRLADEIDAAQERGELATGRPNKSISNENTFADVGLTANQVFNARKLRDAEAQDAGAIDRAIDAAFDKGDPTRAEMKRQLFKSEPKPNNKNPFYEHDADRDAFTQFWGACSELIAETDTAKFSAMALHAKPHLLADITAARDLIQSFLSATEKA